VIITAAIILYGEEPKYTLNMTKILRTDIALTLKMERNCHYFMVPGQSVSKEARCTTADASGMANYSITRNDFMELRKDPSRNHRICSSVRV